MTDSQAKTLSTVADITLGAIAGFFMMMIFLDIMETYNRGRYVTRRMYAWMRDLETAHEKAAPIRAAESRDL